MTAKALYRIRVKSLTNPEGAERLVCRECAEHARYIADSQGPRWYINGNPFEYVDTTPKGPMSFTNWPVSHSQGICPECEARKDSEARIIANIEGTTYSSVRSTL